ncbi:MAG: cation diffusion facilitator family transporter [Actinomycetota bacterium]|jgi:cation diffusion facilitator family transporter|nr:cation diffusion facilitator family transporter [Actinomycetota bacterium]
MAGGSTKAIVAAFFANLGIAIAKMIGFIITRSSSMLAESIHSFADTSNQALLLYGGRASVRTATPRHQFGYGRERFFWSFVVALVLFSLGSLFAVYEGIEKIRHPHEIDSPMVAISILLLGIVLEGGSLRTAIVEARRIKRDDQSWWDFIRNSRSPELPVVLLEDWGAMIGLVLALGAVSISTAFDAPIWDGIGTLTIGVLLGFIAIVLAVEMKSLLIGEGATIADQEAIEAAIEAGDDVEQLIHIRTQHIGPEDILVAAKVHFADDLDTAQLADAIDAAEKRIRTAIPMSRLIYLEPDLYDSNHPPKEEPDTSDTH